MLANKECIMSNYQIKRLNQDFCVNEVLSIIPYSSKECVYIYTLEKSGYRTLEVIQCIENYLSIKKPNKIGFSGLKDEDGVTIQYVSLPYKLSQDDINGIYKQLNKNDDQYMKLRYYATAKEHLQVGKLHGNCFTIKIRNLSKHRSELIMSKKEHYTRFINYYGPQRFGLPGQIKNTASIGMALFNKNYPAALDGLSKQSSPEAKKAREHTGSAECYFETMDQRLVSFYQSSYFSQKWNQALITHIKQHSMPHNDSTIDLVQYPFLTNSRDIARLLLNKLSLKNTRARVDDKLIEYQQYIRSPVVETKILTGTQEKDAMNQGKYACTISLFLPSGCYASIAVPQFLLLLETIIEKNEHKVQLC